MGAWEDFHQDWRVHCLLRPGPATTPDVFTASVTAHERAGLADRRCRSRLDIVHLRRELLDAVRVHALRARYRHRTAQAEMHVIPPFVQASVRSARR